MDDLERVSCALLLLIVVAKLAREAKGLLEPLPSWPSGVGRPRAEDEGSAAAEENEENERREADVCAKSTRDDDGVDFLTPEAEFERWAKDGAMPKGKRLAVSVSALAMVLVGIPVWARTTWTPRAAMPTEAIAAEVNGGAHRCTTPPRLDVVLPLPSGVGRAEGGGDGHDGHEAAAAAAAAAVLEAMSGAPMEGGTVGGVTVGEAVRVSVSVAFGDGACVTRGDDGRRAGSASMESESGGDRGGEAGDGGGGGAAARCACAALDGTSLEDLAAMSDADVDRWLNARAGRHVSDDGAQTRGGVGGARRSEGGDDDARSPGTPGGRRAGGRGGCGGGGEAHEYVLVMLPVPVGAWRAEEAAPPSAGALTLGTGRAAWLRYPVPEGGHAAATSAAASAATSAGPAVASYFTTGAYGAADDADADVAAESASPLQPDGGALLSFTLVNAAPDPRSGHLYSWRFGDDVERRFVSHVTRALRPLASIRVESQVLYHAPSRVAPTWNDTLGAFALPASEAPFFVDADWNLDTSPAELTARPLHLVTYVPPKTACPLRLVLSDGTPSAVNAFVVPGWGGVVVWNPPTCVGGEGGGEGGGGKSALGDGAGGGGGFRPTYLTGAALDAVMEAAVGQVRALLGLPPSAPGGPALAVSASGGKKPKTAAATEVRSVAATSSGFAAWEVDALVRARAEEARRAATASLASLSAVVAATPDMDVPAGLVQSAERSLAALKRTRGAGSTAAAAAAAREAHVAAESAFFHPDIISLLYFPYEFAFAVYVPLFLPTLLPIVTGVCWDAKFFVRRRRCAAEHARRRTNRRGR